MDVGAWAGWEFWYVRLMGELLGFSAVNSTGSKSRRQKLYVALVLKSTTVLDRLLRGHSGTTALTRIGYDRSACVQQ